MFPPVFITGSLKEVGRLNAAIPQPSIQPLLPSNTRLSRNVVKCKQKSFWGADGQLDWGWDGQTICLKSRFVSGSPTNPQT